MSRCPAVLAVVTVLCGCPASKQFDTTHVHDIQQGSHDKAQITEWFGEPHLVVTSLKGHPRGCAQRWQWSYAHSAPTGETVSVALVVDFGKDDRVCDHAYSEIKQ